MKILLRKLLRSATTYFTEQIKNSIQKDPIYQQIQQKLKQVEISRYTKN